MDLVYRIQNTRTAGEEPEHRYRDSPFLPRFSSLTAMQMLSLLARVHNKPPNVKQSLLS